MWKVKATVRNLRTLQAMKTRTKRQFSRDKDGVLLQICRTCEELKSVHVDFYVKHPHLQEPYRRSTECIECAKPRWRKSGKRIRKELREHGLNSHYKPYKKSGKIHPWSVMGKFRRQDENILGNN
jgi:hypothetical protein